MNCEREKQIKQEHILNTFLNMTDDELQAIKILAKEKAKEIKQSRIKLEIRKLEQELEG